MSFKDGDWNTRREQLGDEAETIFEQHADTNYIRFGLERPPLQVWRIPARIRHAPDYLMTNKFVEVMGVGKDQRLKLKIEKHGALHWWSDIHPVHMFIFDAQYQRYCYVTLEQVDELLGGAWGTRLETFPEGKPYFSIPAAALFETSQQVGEVRAQKTS